MTTESPVPETTVPPDESPDLACPYCGRPFRSSHLRDLHIGERHESECTPTEREAYETAVESERDDLFMYQLKVVFALGLLYVLMVLTLLIVL